MKKKKIAAALSAVMMTSNMIAVYASEPVIEVLGNRKISVAITDGAETEIAVRIRNKNSNSTGYIDEKMSDSKGVAVFDFVLPGNAFDGRYVLSWCVDGNDARETEFDYADITELIVRLNGTNDPAAISGLLSEDGGYAYTAKVMGFDMDNYLPLTADEKAKVVNNYLLLRNGTEKEHHVTALSKALGISLGKTDKKLRALELYNPVFENKEFNKISDSAEKQWIVNAFLLTGDTSGDFEQSYTTARTIYNINHAKPNQIMQIIEKYASLLTVTQSPKYTSYTGMSVESKGAVCDKMTENLGEKYTAAEVRNVFENAVNAVLSPNVNPGSGSGSGSGGGNGGSSGGGRIPIIKPGVSENPTEVFSDLTGFDWAKAAVETLSKKGVIAGYNDGTFKPQNVVTREEFVKMAVCAAGIENAAAECDFNDVGKDAWYYKYISSAVDRGIISGVDKNRFGVGETVTRQDMAVIIARCIETLGTERQNIRGGMEFADNGDIADYARDSVNKMYMLGIINGLSETVFGPLEQATRAQAAKILFDTFYNHGGVTQ